MRKKGREEDETNEEQAKKTTLPDNGPLTRSRAYLHIGSHNLLVQPVHSPPHPYFPSHFDHDVFEEGRK